jgi:DinB superfamily
MEELKYPIGKFKAPEVYDDAFRKNAIKELEALPTVLVDTVLGLPAKELKGKYRPDAWSIQQVVHHIADSHMNCLIRIKLALTEDHPTIKPYNENKWAFLADGNSEEIEDSILIIEGVHKRLVRLLKSIKGEEWERTVHHPESKRDMSINFLLALYSWHGKHHLAHINNAIKNPY